MGFFKAQNAQKPVSAEASPRTPLGELTTLPRPPSWLTWLGRGTPIPLPLDADLVVFDAPVHLG